MPLEVSSMDSVKVKQELTALNKKFDSGEKFTAEDEDNRLNLLTREIEIEEKGEKPNEPPKEEVKEGSDKETLSDEQILEADDSTLDETLKAKKAELVKAKEEAIAKEEETLVNTPDEKLDDEAKEKKVELLKVREENTQKVFKEKVKTYATERRISEDEAKAELDSMKRIAEKYQADPEKMANALLNLQKSTTKAQEELKRLKEEKAKPEVIETTPSQWEEKISKGEVTYNDKKLSKEQVVRVYRMNNPDIAGEEVSDEVVVRMAARDFANISNANIKKSFEKQTVEIQNKAKDIRESILKEKETLGKFYDTVKETIDNIEDNFIVDKAFDVKNVVAYVKGTNYDSDVKEAYEKGLAEGKKQIKIIDKKLPIGKGSGSGTGSPKKDDLTSEQKKRMNEMYDGTTMTEEEKVASFRDYLDHEKKLKNGGK